ncbi:hypothetical protein Pcinc_040041 [Petrolisthes cinctipes]|uniref:CUB domain-containing protein n=1 Tax=Petrolisthes cinctipes TaxID=88211 RepID=A0AAE1BMF7_PETCI|nr:hypothetical protein Pcinc_040041 [Petrolisthes cinctipes]
MDIMLGSIILVCVYIQTASSQVDQYYDKYYLPSPYLCNDGREEGEITIAPWRAAIIKFGESNDTNASPHRRSIHKCKLVVKTDESFGLAALIEEMRIPGSINKNTNAWECDGDYIKMSTVGSTPFTQLLDLIVKSKTTEHLCGNRTKKNMLTEVGANANILSTSGNKLEVFFHQSKRKATPINNYFNIIITTYTHHNTRGCGDEFSCRGTDNYCIGDLYRCDGHYNCAFQRGRGDEYQCTGDLPPHPIFSTTTTIITVLASIVGAGFVLGLIVTIIRKCCTNNNNNNAEGTMIGGGVGRRGGRATAPPLHRQQTLPPYEAVVMADVGKVITPPSPAVPEVPPSYNSLFPEGPPPHLTPDRSPSTHFPHPHLTPNRSPSTHFAPKNDNNPSPTTHYTPVDSNMPPTANYTPDRSPSAPFTPTGPSQPPHLTPDRSPSTHYTPVDNNRPPSATHYTPDNTQPPSPSAPPLSPPKGQ